MLQRGVLLRTGGVLPRRWLFEGAWMDRIHWTIGSMEVLSPLRLGIRSDIRGYNGRGGVSWWLLQLYHDSGASA